MSDEAEHYRAEGPPLGAVITILSCALAVTAMLVAIATATLMR